MQHACQWTQRNMPHHSSTTRQCSVHGRTLLGGAGDSARIELALYVAPRCTTLQPAEHHIATQCTTLQRSATHCNTTLEHSSAWCNTVEHLAARRNMMQPSTACLDGFASARTSSRPWFFLCSSLYSFCKHYRRCRTGTGTGTGRFHAACLQARVLLARGPLLGLHLTRMRLKG